MPETTEYPSTWEEVADIERLRVPNGWLVAGGRGIHRAPTFVLDPTWSWRVVEPPPPPPPPPPGPEPWSERCRKVLDFHSAINHLPRGERTADRCHSTDLSEWQSDLVPLRVCSSGLVTLRVLPRLEISRLDWIEVCDGRSWLDGTDALREEAERVVAAVEVRVRQCKEDRARADQEETEVRDAWKRSHIDAAVAKLEAFNGAT